MLLSHFTATFRSSHPEVFLGKGEQPWRSVVSIKLLWNFIEITLRLRCSPTNLLHILRTPFPQNTSARLLLNIRKTILVTTCCLKVVWKIPFSIWKVNDLFVLFTAQKRSFSTRDFFNKCDRIRSFLKKSLMENFIFCVVFIAIWVPPIALRHWGNPKFSWYLHTDKLFLPYWLVILSV